MEKLYIIDASGYLYSSYFAIRNMTNQDGKSTNALYGFIRSVLKLIRDFDVKHIVAVFDGPRNAKKRKDIYADYKAHRTEMPSDLLYQIEWAREFCALYGIFYLNIPEVEADDTMGSIAVWADRLGCQSFLCTSDKDMAQVVNETIYLLNTRKDNLIIGPSGVEEIHGVPPNLIVDLLSMIGDASDNIPGIPSIGPKTAVSLLKEFGSLKEILAHPERISAEKKRKTIIENQDKALLSQQLVALDLNVDIPKDEKSYLLMPPQADIRHFYSSHQFRSLVQEFDAQNADVFVPVKEKENLKESIVIVVDDEQKLETLYNTLINAKDICFMIDEIPPLPQKTWGTIKAIHFAIQSFKIEQKNDLSTNTSWTISFEDNPLLDTMINFCQLLFGNKELAFFGYDVKLSLHLLSQYGIKIYHISFDLLLASYLLNSHHRKHALTDLLNAFDDSLSLNPSEDIHRLCQLKQTLEKEILARGFQHLMYEIELPLLKILEKMEEHGIFVDVNRLKMLSISIQQQIEDIQTTVYEMAGMTFNLSSPKQVTHVLQDKLNIKLPKKTATGFSTSADILEDLQAHYPIASELLKFRTLEKLRSTYIDSLPANIDLKTGRIHCTFNQSVAATGRLSCQNPNLQNIPIRSADGLKIREAFIPGQEGWSYLAADYSQIELRLLAHFSEDETLLKAFKNNEDIHTITAATLLDIPIHFVTKEMRAQAKAVNFGILYGQQAFGLAKEIHSDMKTAAAFIDTYFKRYPRIKDYIESCKHKARDLGRTTTITGRERLIPDIKSPNSGIRSQAERLAVNTPLQGTAADLIKIAMIQIDQRLKSSHLKGYLVLQIHDELIFEVPDTEILTFSSMVKTMMENVFTLKVPLVVDIMVGKNWKEC